MLDVVLAPSEPLRRGTDVPGEVAFRQGGSAANTARWLARLGARSTLVCAVGRDPAGRALVDGLRGQGVAVQASRVRGIRTGRIGVVVAPGGERSFVADRGAADRLEPGDLRAGWFARAAALHLPAYSLLTDPLGAAAREAVRLTRAAGGRVSVDLASAGPILASGSRVATGAISAIAPDVLFGTAPEFEALGRRLDDLTAIAPLVVVKRGPKGATVLQRAAAGAVVRFEVAAHRIAATDTTGAGDAFDAGFLVAWLGSRSSAEATQAVLHRAALAGHRAAVRQLTGSHAEVSLA
jgi:sugar/nucleoside kinase (ribokinase family)